MMQIPIPGSVTNVSGVPNDLRKIPQWVLWKPVMRGKKLTKVPVFWMDPRGDNVNAHDPQYWGTFEQCVAEMQADPRFGIGLVLDNTGIICMDYDDHDGDDAAAVAAGAEAMRELVQMHPSYHERSVSGKGIHGFYKGVLPHGRTGGLIDAFNVEIYAAQFIAITGNPVLGSHPVVADAQGLIDSWRLPPPVAQTTTIEPTEALFRCLTMSDAQVLETMMSRRRSIFDMMASVSDLRDRSTSYAQIIGDLDKITGDPRQIDRIIRKCPFFKNAFNSSKYENTPKWLGKFNCSSMLEYWLRQARKDNTESIQYSEILTDTRKAQMAELCEAFARERVEKAEQAVKETIAAAVTEKELSYDVKGDDPIAQLHFLLEDNIPGNYDELTIPPGAVGGFVNALGTMLTGPRLTYALPAVLSTLSGYLGQTFKTPGLELGLVNHFVIAGQMNTGKTSTMSVFTKAVDLSLSGYYRNPQKPTKLSRVEATEIVPATRRMIETRAASVQGLFDAISHLGSAVWFADEAETQIETMSNGQQHGTALKAFYKQTFDQSQATASTSIDSSRASANLGMTPILNMTLPTYFSCTSEVFETIGTKELVDGTYSRVNMIYDERPMDSIAADDMLLHKGLPFGLASLMQKIAFLADDTAAAYDQSGLTTLMKQTIGAKAEKTKEDFRKQFEINKRAGADKVITMEYTPAALSLKNRISALCRQLGHDANPHIGKWPVHYQVLARTDLLPVMIAGVLAACDMLGAWNIKFPPDNAEWRRDMPQVVIEERHLQWAFEFVMYWRMHFFKAWDQGKIAVAMSDDEVVMERLIRRALNSKEARLVDGTKWAPAAYVVKLAKQVAPFKQADIAGRTAGRAGSTVMAQQCLERMVKQGHALTAKAEELKLVSRELLVSLAKERL